MSTVPTNRIDGDQINDSGFDLAARVAIRNSFDYLHRLVQPADRAAAVEALRFPRADLDDEHLDVVLAAYFDGAELPPGAKDLDATPCPSWCSSEHKPGDQNEWEPGCLHIGLLLREQNEEGDGLFIDTNGDVRVELLRYDDALEGRIGTPNFTITGEAVSPGQARRVIAALERGITILEEAPVTDLDVHDAGCECDDCVGADLPDLYPDEDEDDDE